MRSEREETHKYTSEGCKSFEGWEENLRGCSYCREGMEDRDVGDALEECEEEGLSHKEAGVGYIWETISKIGGEVEGRAGVYC